MNKVLIAFLILLNVVLILLQVRLYIKASTRYRKAKKSHEDAMKIIDKLDAEYQQLINRSAN